MTSDAEPPVVRAIRCTQGAIRDIVVAWSRFAESADQDIADAWESGSKTEIGKLAQYPQRFSESEADVFSVPVRRMMYRRTRRSAAYFVCFTLRTSPEDAPTLLVMHIRHTTQRPMTRKEAREIESSE